MSEIIDELFLNCLEAMDAGQDPERVLTRYPAEAPVVRALLRLDEELRGLPAAPPAGAQARAEKFFLVQGAAMKRARARREGWWRPLVAALAALVVLLSVALGGLRTSAAALPGDTLYPVKRLNENARLRLAGDQLVRIELAEVFERERIREVEQLLRLGRNEEVECGGDIAVLAFDFVEIYGLAVEITDKTVVNGKLELGAHALVQGYTENGRYIARSITIVEPLSVPAQPATATPGSASTLEPMGTDNGAAGRAATESPEPSPTLGATPTLGQTQPPAPTRTPRPQATPDDDECDSSGPGNPCQEEEEEEECDSSGPGNPCDEEEEEEECDSSGSGNSCND